jgi:hypothetical protein
VTTGGSPGVSGRPPNDVPRPTLILACLGGPPSRREQPHQSIEPFGGLRRYKPRPYDLFMMPHDRLLYLGVGHLSNGSLHRLAGSAMGECELFGLVGQNYFS